MEINELKNLLESVKKLTHDLEGFESKEIRELPISLRNELRKIEFLPQITAEGLESVNSMIDYLVVGQATIEDLIKNIEEINNPPKLADPAVTPTQSTNTESSNEKTIDSDSNAVKIDDSIDSMQWLDTTPAEQPQPKKDDTQISVTKPADENIIQKNIEPTPTPKLTTNSVQRNPQIVNQPKTKEIVDIFDGPNSASINSSKTNSNVIQLPKPTPEPKPEPTITLAKPPVIDSKPTNVVVNEQPIPATTPSQPEPQTTPTNDNSNIDFGPFVQK